MIESYARTVSVAAGMLMVVALHGQERAIPAAVQPFVSVNATLVALTHVQLVDGTGLPARPDQTVILRGPVIESVGPFDDDGGAARRARRGSVRSHRHAGAGRAARAHLFRVD